MAAGQVVLADGSVHGQRVLGHMGGEGAVGEVDAVVRAAVDDDRQLGGRDPDALDPAAPTRPTGRICPVQGRNTVAWPCSLVKRTGVESCGLALEITASSGIEITPST